MASRQELFRAGVVTGRGAGFILSGGAARGSPTTVHRIAGGRSVEQWKVPFALHDCCAITTPTEGVVAIGPPDRFVIVDDEGLREGHLYKQCSPAPARTLYGALSGLGSIGGQAWAVGLDGLAWRLDGPDRWTTFEDPATTDEHLDCIGGLDTPLASGSRGVTFSIGKKWKRLASAPLHAAMAMAFDESGRCALAGRDRDREAAVCVLEKGRWKTLAWAAEERPEALQGVGWFKNQLYASGFEGVVRLEKGRLVPVGLPEGATTAYLAAGEELWSIGERDVLRFDGKTWKPIAFGAKKKVAP